MLFIILSSLRLLWLQCTLYLQKNAVQNVYSSEKRCILILAILVTLYAYFSNANVGTTRLNYKISYFHFDFHSIEKMILPSKLECHITGHYFQYQIHTHHDEQKLLHSFPRASILLTITPTISRRLGSTNGGRTVVSRANDSRRRVKSPFNQHIVHSVEAITIKSFRGQPFSLLWWCLLQAAGNHAGKRAENVSFLQTLPFRRRYVVRSPVLSTPQRFADRRLETRFHHMLPIAPPQNLTISLFSILFQSFHPIEQVWNRFNRFKDLVLKRLRKEKSTSWKTGRIVLITHRYKPIKHSGEEENPDEIRTDNPQSVGHVLVDARFFLCVHVCVRGKVFNTASKTEGSQWMRHQFVCGCKWTNAYALESANEKLCHSKGH